MLQRWFLEAKGSLESSTWTNDQVVSKWLQEELDTENATGSCLIARNLRELRHHNIVNRVKELMEEQQPRSLAERRLDSPLLKLEHSPAHANEPTGVKNPSRSSVNSLLIFLLPYLNR